MGGYEENPRSKPSRSHGRGKDRSYQSTEMPPPYGSPESYTDNDRLDPEPGDILIALMGMTGVGKSSFITLFTGEDGSGPIVGHDLDSCTSVVEFYPCKLSNGTRLFLVDTPGFDDTHRKDTDVLRDIANFFAETYKRKILLTGIIYLHRITDDRMTGSAARNLTMFTKLCGKDCLSSVILATTMWTKLAQSDDQGVGEFRLRQLREKFWADLIKHDAKDIRHDGTLESAEEILGHLIKNRQKRKPVVLDIQDEIINKHLNLSDTSAGRDLEDELLAQQKKFQKEILELQRDAEEARRERDLETVREIKKLEAEYQRKIKSIENDKRRLHVESEQLRREEAENARMTEKSGRGKGRKTRWLIRGAGAAVAWGATVLTAGAAGPLAAAGLGVMETVLQTSKYVKKGRG